VIAHPSRSRESRRGHPYMMTGAPPRIPVVRGVCHLYPKHGLGDGAGCPNAPPGLPAYFSLGQDVRDRRAEFFWGRIRPFVVERTRTAKLSLAGWAIPRELSEGRFEGGRSCGSGDRWCGSTIRRRRTRCGRVDRLYYEQGYILVISAGCAAGFRYYGNRGPWPRNMAAIAFGQRCLLARRAGQAGGRHHRVLRLLGPSRGFSQPFNRDAGVGQHGWRRGSRIWGERGPVGVRRW